MESTPQRLALAYILFALAIVISFLLFPGAARISAIVGLLGVIIAATAFPRPTSRLHRPLAALALLLNAALSSLCLIDIFHR